MPASRSQRMWGLVAGHARALGEALAVGHSCEVCRTTTLVDGVGLTLMAGPMVREPRYATGAVARRLEELQFTLGEGPCVDAFDSGGPVLIPDLEAREATSRWVAFAAAARNAGVRAVFAFPVQSGAVRLGTLTLHRQQLGSLEAEELADALVFADIALLLVLEASYVVAAAAAPLDGASEERAEVYQATGMISAQLGVSVGEALARLRAYAFVHDRVVTDVARNVVTRVLRFDPDDDC